jgi:hypothetical protein
LGSRRGAYPQDVILNQRTSEYRPAAPGRLQKAIDNQSIRIAIHFLTDGASNAL